MARCKRALLWVSCAMENRYALTVMAGRCRNGTLPGPGVRTRQPASRAFARDDNTAASGVSNDIWLGFQCPCQRHRYSPVTEECRSNAEPRYMCSSRRHRLRAIACFGVQSLTRLRHPLAVVAQQARSMIVHRAFGERSPIFACGAVAE
jgi:hypothetical protein